MRGEFFRSTSISATSDEMKSDDLTQLLPGSVTLRAVTFDSAEAAVWRRWISAEEEACMGSFGSEKRCQEFLAGRAAARQVLADVLDTSPARVPLRRGDDEGVDVGVGDWHVSIAHSGLHALAVCAQYPVGVDLEHIQPRDPAIARFLFAPADQGIIETLPYDHDTALILCWSLKEAVLKARRSGFRASPKDIQLEVQPDSGAAVAEVQGGERWFLHYSELQGYWGAVALSDSGRSG